MANNASTADSPGRCDSEGRDRQQSSSVWEIEEESELFEINHGRASIKEEISLTDAGSMFSVDVNGSGEGAEECVYVGVGKGDSSLEAVAWAAAQSSSATVVYLIHVFPQVHHIPSPLGKLPKRQVSGERVEKYMAEERDKRRELLQRFINKCSASASASASATASKVKVETVLIESDLVAKAMVELIPILNIRKLVLGTNRSNVRKLKHRKGGNSNIAAQVLQSSPEWCEISVISQGKLVLNTTAASGSSPSSTAAGSSSSPSPPPPSSSSTTGEIIKAAAVELEELQVITSSNHNDGDAFACMCFRSPKVAI